MSLKEDDLICFIPSPDILRIIYQYGEKDVTRLDISYRFLVYCQSGDLHATKMMYRDYFLNIHIETDHCCVTTVLILSI